MLGDWGYWLGSTNSVNYVVDKWFLKILVLLLLSIYIYIYFLSRV